MVKIYGCSDDLIEIENSEYKEDEIGCFDKDVRIWFEDGTVILVGYGKKLISKTIGVWRIEIEKTGSAYYVFTPCFNEDAEVYSDTFEIDSEIKKHAVVEPKIRE